MHTLPPTTESTTRMPKWLKKKNRRHKRSQRKHARRLQINQKCKQKKLEPKVDISTAW